MTNADRLKSQKIQLRLTPLERENLAALASKNQMGLSEYIRWLIRRESEKLK
jgi:hypothetical protein